jgi:hypothetical protein
MTITSKFNRDDMVWVMHANKPMQRKIVGIRMTADYYNNIYIDYSFSNQDNYTIHEYQIFATKEELLNSL